MVVRGRGVVVQAAGRGVCGYASVHQHTGFMLCHLDTFQDLRSMSEKRPGREGGDGPNLGGPKLPRPFVPGYRAVFTPM